MQCFPQLSSDMLTQHWLSHSQGIKVPHQHLSLLFDVYFCLLPVMFHWVFHSLLQSARHLHHGALTNALCDRAPLSS